MGFKEKYTTKEKAEKDKQIISAEAYAIAEVLEEEFAKLQVGFRK